MKSHATLLKMTEVVDEMNCLCLLMGEVIKSDDPKKKLPLINTFVCQMKIESDYLISLYKTITE